MRRLAILITSAALALSARSEPMTFTDVSDQMNFGGSSVVAWCDYGSNGWQDLYCTSRVLWHNDGDLDLYITSVYAGRPSFLYQYNNDLTFSNITSASGTRVTSGKASWTVRAVIVK